MSCTAPQPDPASIGQELGGINDLASSIVSVPTFLALCAFFLASLQGVVALESNDPCRISSRKMNILLFLEGLELVASFASELLSFVELRSAFNDCFPWLHWVPPCLLAAGVLETIADLYFTLAVITKSRIGWIPVSVVGAAAHRWQVAPFPITFLLSLILIGWRLRWWWKGTVVVSATALNAVMNEVTLQPGVMGFAVGWTVGITSLVLIVIILTDCSEDGANYIASIPYLWRPDRWIDEQHIDTKVWYRETTVDEQVVQEYISSAILDANVPVPETAREVRTLLEKKPLHCGNAIVGHDQAVTDKEDRAAARLHNVVLLSEHLVVMPLLIVVVVVVARLHDTLDQPTFNAIRQLADSAIILAFLELAIGIKNVVWSVSGTPREERAKISDSGRLELLQILRNDSTLSTDGIPRTTVGVSGATTEEV